MTDQEINVAIAKECGWHSIDHKSALGLMGMKGPLRGFLLIPDYCNNLNAMHEAEEILTLDGQRKFADNPFAIAVNGLKDPEPHVTWLTKVHATARQRAEALLRTLGKWNETSHRDTPDSAQVTKDSSNGKFMKTKKYTVEPHGEGYAVYQGRDQYHHGFKLGMLTECEEGLPSLIEAALNRDLEAGEALAEMHDKILSLEFRLSQEQQKNSQHEQDYLAVWKAIKEPSETVVQAVRRVVLERDKALMEVEATRRGRPADGEEVSKRKGELEEALERISQASAHVMKMMRPFCENFSPPVRAAMTEILDIASKALEKKGSRGSDENAPDGLPAQVGAAGAEEDVNSENELNRECGIIDLFVLHLRNIRDSSASADELRDYARALLVCHGLDKPRNAEGAGVSAEKPASGEGVPMQSPEDGK